MSIILECRRSNRLLCTQTKSTKIIENNIDFTIVNGENAANEGVGITQNIVDEFLSCGVDIVTSGNHIWDQENIRSN